MNKIKLVISGIHYPLSMMSYFIRAFERRSDVDVFLIGPFTGNWIPWTKGGTNGMRLPQKHVKVPDITLPQEFIGKSPTYKIVPKLDFTPDLFLQIDAGFHFSSRPEGSVVALVKTDPHAISKQYYEIPKLYSDISFGMQTPYMESDEIYLPYAFDPTVHYPETQKIEYDACLIGLMYDHRNKLISKLRADGLRVYYDIGEIYDEYRWRYNKSRVALSWSSLLDTPARVFEAFGMGVPLVANRTPDLMSLFVEDSHFLGFDNVDEGVDKVKWAVRNSHGAQNMADRAKHRATQYHTWDHRVEQILKACELI